MNIKSNIKFDFMASLVVFIIAVPLSLGISLASGVPPALGILSAILGGIIVGFFTGAPLMVSGPAAGLTVLVFQIVQSYGLKGLMIATMVCGLIQVLMGVFKLGNVFTLVPKAVLEGMLAAIGFIILMGQLHVLVGSSIPASPVEAFISWPSIIINQISENPLVNLPIIACGILAIGIQFAWPKLSKKVPWIPAALPAVIVVTMISLYWTMPRVKIEALDSVIASSFSNLMDISLNTQILGAMLMGLGLAIVASAESLLTARATQLLAEDNKIQTKTCLNKELLAQGLGNFTAGILGGIPLTGVIVRSSANINSGGKTKLSTILHGFWVLLFMVALPFLLEAIPLTALAAVLIVTGIKLLNIGKLVETWKEKRTEAICWVITSVAIIATNLLLGLLIGLVITVGLTYLQKLNLSSDEVMVAEEQQDNQ